jgi:hypothetical protein
MKLTLIKTKVTSLLSALLLTSCQTTDLPSHSNNTLSAIEKSDGWQVLFDGKTPGHWRGFKRKKFPNNWIIVDGTLHMKGAKNMTKTELDNRSDLIYGEKFENFILKLDWKISEKGNSGVFYLGQEYSSNANTIYDYMWRTAPEMQILDNIGHIDANRGKNGNRQAGSLYDLIPAKPQNAAPVGQWNSIEISVNNRTVTHKQNGEVVVSYQMDTEYWKNIIANSKFPSLNPNWHDVAKSGFIGLQDHDDEVWFRNIKIKKL